MDRYSRLRKPFLGILALAVMFVAGCPGDNAPKPDDNTNPGNGSNPDNTPTPPPTVVNSLAVVGDIEGDLRLFDSVVRNSTVLKYVNGKYEGPDSVVLAGETSKVRFMGDISDHGDGNLEMLDNVLSIEKRHNLPDKPKRVGLTIGNRDINKIRLLFEIFGDINFWPFPEWKTAFDNHLAAQTPPVADFGLNAATLTRDQILKLEWLFTAGQATFGAPVFLTKVMAELKVKKSDPNLSKEMVLKHLKDDYLAKDGPYHTYLKKGDLIDYDEAHKSLFPHGGITKDNWGVMPDGARQTITTVADMKKWIADVNAWKDERVKLAFEGDRSDPAVRAKVYELIAYQQPPKTVLKKDANNRETLVAWAGDYPASLIQARYWGTDPKTKNDLTREALPPMKDYLAFLRYIFFGHTPKGQAVIVMGKKDEVQLVGVDTSKNEFHRAASVELTANNDLYIDMKVNVPEGAVATKIMYRGETDPELGGFTLDADGRHTWNLGKTADGKRLRVTYTDGGGYGKPNYTLAP